MEGIVPFESNEDDIKDEIQFLLQHLDSHGYIVENIRLAAELKIPTLRIRDLYNVVSVTVAVRYDQKTVAVKIFTTLMNSGDFPNDCFSTIQIVIFESKIDN